MEGGNGVHDFAASVVLEIYGRIIIKWIFERLHWGGGGIEWIDLAQNRGRCAGCCECGDELPDFIKCGGFFQLVKTC
jgi:hypothetical protein